jgi:hypothetical protein
MSGVIVLRVRKCTEGKRKDDVPHAVCASGYALAQILVGDEIEKVCSQPIRIIERSLVRRAADRREPAYEAIGYLIDLAGSSSNEPVSGRLQSSQALHGDAEFEHYVRNGARPSVTAGSVRRMRSVRRVRHVLCDNSPVSLLRYHKPQQSLTDRGQNVGLLSVLDGRDGRINGNFGGGCWLGVGDHGAACKGS